MSERATHSAEFRDDEGVAWSNILDERIPSGPARRCPGHDVLEDLDAASNGKEVELRIEFLARRTHPSITDSLTRVGLSDGCCSAMGLTCENLG